MSRPDRLTRTIGWSFVGGQALCLGAVVVASGRDDWATPWWVLTVGWATIGAGATVGLWASRSLGSALTPTPEPRAGDRLRTDGPYRYVRHPIYSAVLLGVVGWTIRSGSVATLVAAVATIAFFRVKSEWEERRLAAVYPDYRCYAERTGRFVPRLARR